MGLLELLMGKKAPAQPQWDAPAPAAPGQPLPTYDPAMAQGLAPFYKWFQDEPDVEGRAQILPLVDVKGGGIRLGMPKMLQETGQGILDLLSGTETGQITPEGTQALMDLASPGVASRPDPSNLGSMRVFHGSRHAFDQPDMSKIGTGEGAQIYGHGLYVAEKPPISDFYRTAGAEEGPVRTSFTKGYADVGPPDKDWDADTVADALPFEPPPEDIQRYTDAMNYIRQNPTDTIMSLYRTGREDLHAPIQALRAHGVISFKQDEPHPGYLYEMEIDPDAEDLLDYEKPFTEQTPAIQEKLRSLKLDPPDPNMMSTAEKETWAETLEELGAYLEDTNEDLPGASDILQTLSGLEAELNTGKINKTDFRARLGHFNSSIRRVFEDRFRDEEDSLADYSEQIQYSLDNTEEFESLLDEVDPTAALEEAPHILNYLHERMSPPEASAALKEAGIPGLRYADASARGKSQHASPTSNIVMFDDSKMKVLNRYTEKLGQFPFAPPLESTTNYRPGLLNPKNWKK